MCLDPILADNPLDIRNWSDKMEKFGLVNMLQKSEHERWRNQDGDYSTAEEQKIEDKIFVRSLTSRGLNHLWFTGVRWKIGDQFCIG